MTLPCWVKWIVSLIGGPAIAVLSLVAIALCMMGVEWLVKRTHRQITPDETARATFRAKIDWWFNRLLGVMVGGIALGSVYLLGALFMQTAFGCDACLPESMQTSCKAAQNAPVANDRAAFERLCYAHPGWCVRIPTDAEMSVSP